MIPEPITQLGLCEVLIRTRIPVVVLNVNKVERNVGRDGHDAQAESNDVPK